MGNHAAGKAMGIAAEMAVLTRAPGSRAIDLLDAICGRYRGCDAEFESEDPEGPGRCHPDYANYTDPHPNAALGMLMVEAFAPQGLDSLPNYVWDPDVVDFDKAKYDPWFAEVERPFSERYALC